MAHLQVVGCRALRGGFIGPFASLAMATLMTGDRSLIGGPVLWAALGALLVSPTRSLLFCLIGGGAGYALATLLL
jgi:hypothetical protein